MFPIKNNCIIILYIIGRRGSMSDSKHENIEYKKFLISFLDKVREIIEDYKNLSNENKNRVRRDILLRIFNRNTN